MANILITNVTVAGIFSAPHFQSEMISQSVLWEKLEILDKQDNWFKVRQFDNYIGWINKFYTIEFVKELEKSATYIETNLFGQIFSHPNINSEAIKHCTLGTTLPATNTKKIENDWWHKVILPNFQEGWILNNGYKKCITIRETIKEIALKLLGVPYVWGGRSSYGFDCSGFIQTIFKFCGILLPRDSKDQFILSGLFTQKSEENLIGDLIFFSKDDKINHIAISLGGNQFIHSSGYVKKNSLDFQDSNYDNNISEMYYQSKSIRKIIVK